MIQMQVSNGSSRLHAEGTNDANTGEICVQRYVIRRWAEGNHYEYRAFI